VSEWDTATRSLSRKVLEQVARQGTPETNWWTASSEVGKELRVDASALKDAVQLLIEEGDVESDTVDRATMRATLRGWMKVPEVWGYPEYPERPSYNRSA
jgi:hypothetical protein